jgi:hypothetical protein
MHEKECNKQATSCEITINNYNTFFPDKYLSDECPICKQYGIDCLLKFHKQEFKYFYAYPFIDAEIIISSENHQ